MDYLRREFKRFYPWRTLIVSLVLVLVAGQVSAASIYFSPSSGQKTVGDTFSVAVRVNTNGVAINAGEGSIVFDPTKLEIISVSKLGSIFTLWASDPVFSNAKGTIDFGGGVPNPGYSGSSGLVLTVNFRAKTATPVNGYTDIVFVSGAVLANDGEGTNILTSTGGGSYSIVTAAPTPTPILGPTPTPAPISTTAIPRPIITSATHPNESAWYSGNNPLFRWDVPDGVTEVLLILSRSSGSVPTIRYSPPISERILENIEEGTWYFSARFRTASGLGPITSFRINIDTQPPRDFTLVRLDPDDTTNPRPLLLFESADTTSGIEKYQIKIGAGEWFDIEPSLAGRPFAISHQRFGEYLVEVRAFDRAGNSTGSSTEIVIKPILVPQPFIKEVVLPQIKAEKVIVKKEEVEVAIKDVVVKEVVVKEVEVKEVMVKEVVAKGLVITEGLAVRPATVIIDILKSENGNSFGQISELIKNSEVRLIKTVEAPVAEGGTFEAKIDDLQAGLYVIRAYAKDERGAISDNFSEVVLRVTGESTFAKFIMGIVAAIMRGFDWIVNTLSNGGLFVAFLVVLIGLILAIIELIRLKARGLFKRFQIQPFIDLFAIKRAQKKSNKNVEHIIKDIEKELKFLRAINKRRTLGPEESYLKNKMEQYLKTLKNIKKIDK